MQSLHGPVFGLFLSAVLTCRAKLPIPGLTRIRHRCMENLSSIVLYCTALYNTVQYRCETQVRFGLRRHLESWSKFNSIGPPFVGSLFIYYVRGIPDGMASRLSSLLVSWFK